MLSLQGQALVASHSDETGPHARSVWAILDHTDAATTTFCLSRSVEAETDLEIRRRVPVIPEAVRILRGGSMDGFEKHMIFVHRDPLKMKPSVELAPKFRISMHHDNVETLREEHAPHCRIVLGFDTWDPGRVEEEIRLGRWQLRDIAHVGATFFKVSPEELWPRLQAH